MLKHDDFDINSFARVLWNFTNSDFKTIVTPTSIFGLVVCLSHETFHGKMASAGEVLRRSPMMIGYVWSLLLLFCVSNQRHQDAIEEDRINKPWRPLANNSIPTEAAHIILYMLFILVPCISHLLGALIPCLALITFTWLHNDLKLGDSNLIARNVLNGLGYTSFNVGAAMVISPSCDVSQTLSWSGLLMLVISTSVHAQDLGDQLGDAERRRNTIPLVYGDGLTRASIALMALFWSAVCPLYLRLGGVGFLPPLLTAAILCFTLFRERGNKTSHGSWKAYLLWFTSLVCLPLMKQHYPSQMSAGFIAAHDWHLNPYSSLTTAAAGTLFRLLGLVFVFGIGCHVLYFNRGKQQTHITAHAEK